MSLLRSAFISTTAGLALCAFAPIARGGEATSIDAMDGASFQPPKEKGTVEQVDGKVGKAVKFTFADDCKGQFAMSRNHGTPEWDKAAGISFWVKGDGSKHCGTLQFVWNEDFAQRYGYAFRVDGTEWTKVVVPWRDFLPELSNADSKPLDPAGDRQPSKLGSLWFGKWWFWSDAAAHAYAIDEIKLEPTIDMDTKDYKPAGASLARVYAKLKAGQPITVVTMGDSLTDTRHGSNKKTNWPSFFKAGVASTYKSDATIVNPAIGGTELRQNLVLMPNWLMTTPEPDLVTVLFGYNDFASGMTGPAFAALQKDTIQRIRRETHGKADVLIITTCPAASKWDEMADLAEACRTAAKDQNAGICDIYALIHELGKDNKDQFFDEDKTHLSALGQQTIAKAVLEALEKNGK
ncbi:MAG: CIA30 family protein [Planctomycetes bacterium]|nr:CIA30 family protein [Planctomycetota bacterium]